MRPILRRALSLAAALLALSFMGLLAQSLAPGDPAALLAGKHATAAQIERIRSERGLDRPLPIRWLLCLAGLARGDLGRSISSSRPVVEEIAERLPATAELAGAAFLLALAGGILLGAAAARRRGTWLDAALMAASSLGLAIPVFVLGLLLLLLFASPAVSPALAIFPVGGRRPSGSAPVAARTGLLLVDALLAGSPRASLAALRHLALPAIALATIPGAAIARMTRASVAGTLDEEFVRAARAKGCGGARLLLVHALRPALAPVLALSAVQLAALLSGAFLTETVFQWPGIGTYMVERLLARDMPAVQGGILAAGLAYVAAGLAADAAARRLDPRLRTHA